MGTITNWKLSREDIRFIGTDLRRPECILAERDGTLWSADGRGGVMRIDPTGNQQLIAQKVDDHFDCRANMGRSLLEGTLPNGMAFARNGDILIANFGTDALEVMTRDGRSRTLCDSIDGLPMGKVNFVLRDSENRIWITVSTRVNPWSEAIRSSLADGYIAVLDEKGIRIVADGLAFANEIKLDAKEEYLYIAETCGKRISRQRVLPDGSLGSREVYGPSNLGTGLIDGFALDVDGNIWLTMIFADRLMVLTPDGESITVLDDGDPIAIERFEAEFATGRPVKFETLAECGGRLAPWMASVTFGGADLRTVYLGSLRGSSIPYFTSPIPGLPMVHW
ncbi:SMP-30/gluconolactonase/LRE family protein [Paraburkholderia sp.]|uniref:SMP-30/gluconolactonase/LRE family protein n=1 Tax=Paraburkholderia sp. TaxID=1926495 RepID=UPI003C7E61DE